MEITFKFSNNQKVHDKVSGISGIINQCTIMDTGNIQYSVLPKSKDGVKREDSWYIDEDSLLIDDDRGSIPIPMTYTFKFETGLYVKDKITGFEGYIFRAILDLNNCIRYFVIGDYNNKTGNPDTHCVDEKYVKIISKKKLNTKKSSTGCTSTRSNLIQY